MERSSLQTERASLQLERADLQKENAGTNKELVSIRANNLYLAKELEAVKKNSERLELELANFHKLVEQVSNVVSRLDNYTTDVKDTHNSINGGDGGDRGDVAKDKPVIIGIVLTHITANYACSNTQSYSTLLILGTFELHGPVDLCVLCVFFLCACAL